MTLLAISAASVGLLHSLSPGHWLPVVLMAKSKKWTWKTAIVGAVVAASGHIILSILLAIVSIAIEAEFLSKYEHVIEHYAGLALCFLGLVYAAMAYFGGAHAHCGSSHAGQPDRRQKKTPFLFLFTLGLSPCVAVIPVAAKAAVQGSVATVLTLIAFAAGVLFALISSTLLVSLGLLKLNHPVFEHYGDLIAGLGVSLMGLLLFGLST